jgi:hypothetical protein
MWWPGTTLIPTKSGFCVLTCSGFEIGSGSGKAEWAVQASQRQLIGCVCLRVLGPKTAKTLAADHARVLVTDQQHPEAGPEVR